MSSHPVYCTSLRYFGMDLQASSSTHDESEVTPLPRGWKGRVGKGTVEKVTGQLEEMFAEMEALKSNQGDVEADWNVS